MILNPLLSDSLDSLHILTPSLLDVVLAHPHLVNLPLAGNCRQLRPIVTGHQRRIRITQVQLAQTPLVEVVKDFAED